MRAEVYHHSNYRGVWRGRSGLTTGARSGRAAPSAPGRLAGAGAAVLRQRPGRAQYSRSAGRQRHQGAAQESTRARDDALAALDAWMSDFVQIARVALQARPQLLEKIGVAVRAR